MNNKNASRAKTRIIGGEFNSGAFRRRYLVIVLAASVAQGVAASQAWSQAGALDAKPAKRTIEEVIVTAQKREQVSQDVPVSMSVISEDFIRDQGITDINDALLYTPNFSVTETANSITPQCRGFVVEDVNAAFEPPCGVAIDGIAYTRAFYFAAALYDTSRLEVLRGPQGTTFGKNTTAGVVSIVTKEPTDEFTANVDFKYGSDNFRRAEIGVGGPIISELLNFRIAGMHEERDGYIENTAAAIDPEAHEFGGGRDRESFRIKLHFLDLCGSQVKLSYEEADLAFVGSTARTVLPEGSGTAEYFRQYDPNADFSNESYKNSMIGDSSGITQMDRLQLDWSFSIAEWDYAFAAAKGELNNAASGEVIPAPVRMIHSDATESSPFKTMEIRTVSPDFNGFFGIDELFGRDLGNSYMLLGAFYQEQRLDASLLVDLRYGPLAGFIASSQGVIVPTHQLDLLTQSLFGEPAGFSETAHVAFDQNAETKAVFGQFTWNMTEAWMLELGGRYSEETKVANWDTQYSVPAALLNPLGERGFVAHRKYNESNFQPKVSLGFSPTDDLNFFLHWTRGFKGGGFNSYTIAGNPEEANSLRTETDAGSLSYGPEEAEEWGLDAKMSLLDNSMRLNVSMYQLTVEDFQALATVFGSRPLQPAVETSLPNGYDEVRNAAKARARGVEVDLLWLANDWLTVIGTIGYNDTEYLNYDQATCPAGSEPDNSDTGRCDVSGEAFPYSSTWNNTLTLQTRLPLGSLWSALENIDFLAGGTVEYNSKYFLSPTLEEGNVQDGYYKYRAHLGLANDLQGWSFRITGVNLGDEYVLSRANFDGTLGTVLPQAPRSVVAQFSWSY